jgi:hypothetical protein
MEPGDSTCQRQAVFLASYLFVSHLIRSESVSLLIKSVTLEISSEDEGDRILRTVITSPTHGLRAIRRLAFTDFNNTTMTEIRPEFDVQ